MMGQNEWGLNDKMPAIVTDNAPNMLRAVGLTETLHVGCFAHVLNLASQAALKVPAVSRLLGRLRLISAFFHLSTIASHELKNKQTAGPVTAQVSDRCTNTLE